MKFFRGLRDINLSDINHRHISDGYYGRATYFALSEDGAANYGTKGSSSHIICSYEIILENTLLLSEKDILNLRHFLCGEDLDLSKEFAQRIGQESKVKSTDFSTIASNLGFDSIILTGKVEGGEQLIIPENSKCRLNLLEIELRIWIYSTETASSFAKYLPNKLNVKIHHEDGRNWFKVVCRASDVEELNQELEFLDRVNNISYYAVNFETRTFKDYDED